MNSCGNSNAIGTEDSVTEKGKFKTRIEGEKKRDCGWSLKAHWILN